jgi:hypothetical protein
MPKTSIILSLLLTVCLAGCVSTANVAIPKARLAQAAGSTVASTSRPRPAFADFKPSNAMFGAIGGLAAVSSGNELIRKYAVEDPATILARELTDHLAASFKLVPQSAVQIPIDSGDTKAIAAAAAGKADFVLDLQTVNWSCIYLPMKWTRYRVMYSVKLRLIDVKKQESVAEGFFAWKTPDGAYNPTYDELFENNADGLRKQLEEARKAATEHFRTQTLMKEANASPAQTSGRRPAAAHR